MTAHINAKSGDFASTIIMPGDPLRAKFIAENYLLDYREVTNVRNMLGYTGYYFGQPVSVMGHGMGIPSMTLYAHELVNDFGVKRIIRVGSLGATQQHVKMRDIILAVAAGTDSITNLKRSSGYSMATSADFKLLHQAWLIAQKSALEKFGVLGIDMEVAGLYGLAHQFAIEALAILTVSDHCLTGEETTAEERQLTFNNMIELALNTAITA